MPEDAVKFASRPHLTLTWAFLGPNFGRTWLSLGASNPSKTMVSARFLAFSLLDLLRFTFPHLQLPDAVLAPSWAILGPSWALLGVILGSSWRPSGLLGASFGPRRDVLGSSGAGALSIIST